MAIATHRPVRLAQSLTIRRHTRRPSGLCRELKTAMQAVGSVAAHPLTGIEAVVWSPVWRNEMQTAIEDVAGQLPALESAAASRRSLALIAHRPGKPRRDGGAGRAPDQAGGARGPAFLTEQGGALRHAIAELRSMQEAALAKRRRLVGRYRNAIIEQDPRGLLQEWTAATNANFWCAAVARRRAAQLRVFADGPVPADPAGDLAILVELSELEREAVGSARRSPSSA